MGCALSRLAYFRSPAMNCVAGRIFRLLLALGFGSGTKADRRWVIFSYFFVEAGLVNGDFISLNSQPNSRLPNTQHSAWVGVYFRDSLHLTYVEESATSYLCPRNKCG